MCYRKMFYNQHKTGSSIDREVLGVPAWNVKRIELKLNHSVRRQRIDQGQLNRQIGYRSSLCGLKLQRHIALMVRAEDNLNIISLRH